MYSKEELQKNAKNMDEIIVKAKQSLANAPEGILRISKKGKQVQYYLKDSVRNLSKETSEVKGQNGKYINKQNIEVAYKLAQRDYDKKVLEISRKQRCIINQFLEQYIPHGIEEVYNNLSPERQNLVTPYVLPQEEYINHWESRTYTGKGFAPDAPEIYTEKGERVRSKSEKIIADKLKLMGIPYLYEFPLQLKGYGTVYPDFTLLNVWTRKEYYLEHFGKMDDASYSEKTILKIKTYERNGIFPGETLLMTYETASHPLDMRIVEDMLQRYLL